LTQPARLPRDTPAAKLLARVARHAGASLLVVCALASGAVSAELRIEISGVPDKLEENVRLSIGEPRDERERSLERYIDSLPALSKTALSALGYYGADVDVDRRDVGEDTVLQLRITPNDPVRIGVINVRIDGAASLDGEYMPVLGHLPLQRNAVFVSGAYDGAKGVLLGRAQDLGYFDFKLTRTEVRVSRRQLTADITLIADSGERHVFGEVVWNSEVLSDAFLERWLPFAEGDPYEARKVGELTRNL